MQQAQEHARQFEQHYVGTEHVLLALVRDDDDTQQLLAQRGVRMEQLEDEVSRLVGAATHPAAQSQEPLPLSPRLRHCVDRAEALRQSMHHGQVEPTHLLLSLLADIHSAAGRALVNLQVDVADLYEQLHDRIG